MIVKVENAEFLKSATGPQGWPMVKAPEIAFAGRSNVGKSSLVNTLIGRRALVKVSSTPGRTRMLNFVDVILKQGSPLRSLRMVDLPGYGYAKVSRDERRRWGPMVESYVRDRTDLALVILVVDSRRPPTELDQSMATWLHETGRPWLVVSTKIDKLPRAKQNAAVRAAERALELEPGSVIAFSAEDATGRDAIWGQILSACLDGDEV